MSKFKIGDRVKYTNFGGVDCVGVVYMTPYDITPDEVLVKFDADRSACFVEVKKLSIIKASPFSKENPPLPSSFKIDVQGYATENNISLEQAHNEIQPWLFEQGYEWLSSAIVVNHVSMPYLYCGTECITKCDNTVEFNKSIYKQIFLIRNVSVSLSVKEEEIVEILGKKYIKSDVENALKNVKEKE